MRRWLLVGIAMLVALSPATTHAAQLKPGASCKKPGLIQGKSPSQFKCMRVGGRLKWVQLKRPNPVASAAAPKPEPVATQTVPPKQFIDEVDRFITNLASSPTNARLATVEMRFVEQPEVRPGITAATRVGLESAVTLYSRLGMQLPSRVLVLIARDNEWLKQQLVEAKCQRTNVDVTSSAAIPGTCADGYVAIATIYGGFAVDYAGLVYQMEMPHELYHLWQLNSAKPGVSITGTPRWLNEGAPQVLARMNWTAQKTAKSAQAWFEEWYQVHRPDLFTMCKGVTATQMEKYDKAWPDPQWCAYSKGQLIVEFLVQRIGWDKFRDLVLLRGDSDARNFPTHFRSVTGEDLSTFYAAADAYATGRGW